MKWNRNTKRKKLKKRLKIKNKSKNVLQRELMIMTKYRPILRQELSNQHDLIEKLKNNINETTIVECKNRQKILKNSIIDVIESTLQYIDKIEYHLKELIKKEIEEFTEDLNDTKKDIETELLKRFNVYVDLLDLSSSDVDITDICNKNITTIDADDEIDTTMSDNNHQLIEELQRKLKALEVEYEDEEIKELASIKLLKMENIKMEGDIFLLKKQMELLSM